MKSQSPLLGSNSIVTTLMNQTVLVDFSWSKIQILFDIAIYIDWQYIIKGYDLMRVISGIYKRRRFDVPRTFKARPTTDFAKENLFNVLNNYIDFEEGVSALDLFAGTGSISIELVSRGCDRVISIEKEPAHHAFISKIMKEVKTDKCLPIRGDVFKFIKSIAASSSISSLPIPLTL